MIAKIVAVNKIGRGSRRRAGACGTASVTDNACSLVMLRFCRLSRFCRVESFVCRVFLSVALVW